MKGFLVDVVGALVDVVEEGEGGAGGVVHRLAGGVDGHVEAREGRGEGSLRRGFGAAEHFVGGKFRRKRVGGIDFRCSCVCALVGREGEVDPYFTVCWGNALRLGGVL